MKIRKIDNKKIIENIKNKNNNDNNDNNEE